MSRRIFLVGVVLFAVGANSPDRTPKVPPGRPTPSTDIADISGYYTCKGKDAGGKSYSGIAVVTRQREVYLIQWMIGAGATFTGIGIRNGDTLAASWALPGDKGNVVRGINIYKIESGPRLVGRWASIPGSGIVQNENLTLLQKVEAVEEEENQK